MIVVTTPTGAIGRQLVAELLRRHEPVRVIARDPRRLLPDVRDAVEIVEGSHDDPAVLDRALPGADALFWLTPPNPAAPSAHEHYLSFARAGSGGVHRHGVGHVVGISSAGHGFEEPAGVLSAAFAMDAELRRSGAAYRALSMPFFMDNLLRQADALRTQGVLSLTCAGDEPLSCIATPDVAAAAADLLSDLTWSGQEDLPLFGPDRLTPEQMAAIIGDELGATIAYRRTGLDDVRAALLDRGASERAALDTVEMLRAQDVGMYDADWARATITSTSLRTWCRDVLVPAIGAHDPTV